MTNLDYEHLNTTNVSPEEIALQHGRETRANLYDKLGDQLDRLFRDIDNGLLGDAAQTGEFYLHIKTIKDANPLG
jgi:hypothetical protein